MRKWKKYLVTMILVAAVAISGLQISKAPSSFGSFVITLGDKVSAADYTLIAGSDNYTVIQDALNALPSTGGTLQFLSTGTYPVTNGGSHTVISRAIDNVTIEGAGQGTLFTDDASTAIFSAGSQSGWAFRNFATDAGSITYASSSKYTLSNLLLGSSYMGLLTDGSNPTGRTASYVIAASDATTQQKAQADQVLAGTNDQVAINAELVTLSALGVKTKLSLVGDFTCNGAITAQSNVDVDLTGTITDTDNSGANGVNFVSTINSTWTNVVLYRVGTGSGTPKAAYCIYNDSTMQLKNCKIYNQYNSSNVGAEGGDGIMIDSGNIYLENCYGQGAATSSTVDNYGISMWNIDGSSPHLVRCTGQGGANGYGICVTETANALLEDCTGIGYLGGFWLNDQSSVLKRCTGIVDGGTTGSAGFRIFCGGKPTMIDCEGITGTATNQYGFLLQEESAPLMIDCYGHPKILDTFHAYTSANSGRFQPITTYPYRVINISIWVHSGNVGKTLDFGTTVGGHEIAQNIDISTAGTMTFSFNKLALAANGYIYVTPSGAIGESDIYIYTNIMYALSGSRGLEIETTGDADIQGGLFTCGSDDGYDQAVRVQTTAMNWSITGATLQTYGVYALFINTPTYNVPVYNCQIIGQTYYVLSYAGRIAGSNTQHGTIAAVYDTIASGSITLQTGALQLVETEGGAASDDLTTIVGGQIGDIIYLKDYNGAHVVTVKNGSGNLYLNGDRVFYNQYVICALIKVNATDWYEFNHGG